MRKGSGKGRGPAVSWVAKTVQNRRHENERSAWENCDSDSRSSLPREDFPLGDSHGSSRKRTHDGDTEQQGQFQLICFHCKRKGHRMSQCYNLHGFPSGKGAGKFARKEGGAKAVEYDDEEVSAPRDASASRDVPAHRLGAVSSEGAGRAQSERQVSKKKARDLARAEQKLGDMMTALS